MHSEHIPEESYTKNNGVIDEKKLFKILGGSNTINRTKTERTPITQDNHLCITPENRLARLTSISTAVKSIKKIDPKLHAIAELQLLYGCRISEVLAIRGTDILKNGHIKIKGLKHSHNRIIIPVESSGYISRFFGKAQYVFDGYDRFFVYRQFKALGIVVDLPGTDRKAVTHAFRYLLASNFKQSKIDTDDTQRFIGHKAKKNTEIYEG